MPQQLTHRAFVNIQKGLGLFVRGLKGAGNFIKTHRRGITKGLGHFTGRLLVWHSRRQGYWHVATILVVQPQDIDILTRPHDIQEIHVQSQDINILTRSKDIQKNQVQPQDIDILTRPEDIQENQVQPQDINILTRPQDFKDIQEILWTVSYQSQPDGYKKVYKCCKGSMLGIIRQLHLSGDLYIPTAFQVSSYKWYFSKKQQGCEMIRQSKSCESSM